MWFVERKMTGGVWRWQAECHIYQNGPDDPKEAASARARNEAISLASNLPRDGGRLRIRKQP